jgi:hypothetical protein
MKRACAFAGWIVEAAIVAGLLWKHTDLYDYDFPFLLFLASPILMVYHWFLLRKEHKKGRFTRAVQLKLFFLTGLSIILCLSLILSTTFEWRRIQLLGGSTKEMRVSLIKMAQNKDDSYPDNIPQWVKYNVEKMKSDQIVYAMLLASTCLLYGCRYYSGKTDTSEDSITSGSEGVNKGNL